MNVFAKHCKRIKRRLYGAAVIPILQAEKALKGEKRWFPSEAKSRLKSVHIVQQL
jgi:hypothetical protein